MNPLEKPGTQTTEFWVSIIPAIGSVLDSQSNPERSKMLMICSTILLGLYIISRTFVKCNRKHVDEVEQ